jgi:N-dimethylarginine dimethylaminohydrolase
MSESVENNNEPQSKKLIDRMLQVLGIEEWVTYSKVVQNGLFIVFLVGLGIIHVANTHLAERSVRNINTKEKELQELRWESMTLKSNLMTDRKQSSLAEKLKETGIEELKVPPQKIIVSKREY